MQSLDRYHREGQEGGRAWAGRGAGREGMWERAAFVPRGRALGSIGCRVGNGLGRIAGCFRMWVVSSTDRLKSGDLEVGNIWEGYVT
jgi:hypothetical protein